MCRDGDEKEDVLRELGVTHMVETCAEAAEALKGLVAHVYVLGMSALYVRRGPPLRVMCASCASLERLIMSAVICASWTGLMWAFGDASELQHSWLRVCTIPHAS